jgi:3-dehydroquinate synthase
MQSPVSAPSAAGTSHSHALRGSAPATAAPEIGYSSTSTIGVTAITAVAASMLKADRKRKGRTQKVLVKSRGGEAVETIPVMPASTATTEINYYKLDEIDAPKVVGTMKSALKAMKGKIALEGLAEEKLSASLCDEDVMSALVSISRLPVFSKEFGTAFKEDLDLLHALKQIKYFWNLPQSQIAILMSQLAKQLEGAEFAAEFQAFTEDLCKSPAHLLAIKEVSKKLPAEVYAKYMENAAYLEDADSHAVYPTSIYRQCDALTLATPDAGTIESVMSTTITTTIKIARNVLDPTNHLLFDVYKPLGRCVAVVDDKVDEYHGAKIDNYFAANNIEFTKLVFSGNEVDKGIEDVERILVAMKKYRVGRHEPLLVIGGGVIADIAGFATSLYSRNTPYVMLFTSIVSGIDAGPSPRVCCNGFDYKNLYGSYHPPVLTITDRGFWKTLHPGWLRHGVAEIIKMAVMKDLSLFELMEKHGPRAVQTKFGTEGDSVNDAEFQDVCDLIVGKAMEGYVRSEYGNLWETHQCRPHAYGHTWCPGYELPAGMLHGQAVGTDMGFGAYLSYVEGWVCEAEMHRVLKNISDCELSLYHPIMDDDEMVWKTHLGIVEKRGGNLCAPIPKPLGFSGYLNDMSKELLAQRMHEYKELVSKYPRGGRGVEELCVEVGLEDPQSKKMQKRAAAELGEAEVAAGKLELLAKLKDVGLLSEEQFKAQQQQIA